MRARQLVIAIGAHEKHGRQRQPFDQICDQVDRGGTGPVKILEHNGKRASTGIVSHRFLDRTK